MDLKKSKSGLFHLRGKTNSSKFRKNSLTNFDENAENDKIPLEYRSKSEKNETYSDNDKDVVNESENEQKKINFENNSITETSDSKTSKSSVKDQDFEPDATEVQTVKTTEETRDKESLSGISSDFQKGKDEEDKNETMIDETTYTNEEKEKEMGKKVRQIEKEKNEKTDVEEESEQIEKPVKEYMQKAVNIVEESLKKSKGKESSDRVLKESSKEASNLTDLSELDEDKEQKEEEWRVLIYSQWIETDGEKEFEPNMYETFTKEKLESERTKKRLKKQEEMAKKLANMENDRMSSQHRINESKEISKVDFENETFEKNRQEVTGNQLQKMKKSQDFRKMTRNVALIEDGGDKKKPLKKIGGKNKNTFNSTYIRGDIRKSRKFKSSKFFPKWSNSHPEYKRDQKPMELIVRKSVVSEPFVSGDRTETEDQPLDISETVPLAPSPKLDLSVEVANMQQKDNFTVFGAKTFLDMPHPPDTPDNLDSEDNTDADFEMNCIVPPLSDLFMESVIETKMSNRHPISLEQCLGQEKDLPVVNLCRGEGLSIFYACCHCGVLYNVERKKQMLLQGHANSISCLTTTRNKKFLVVADRGPNSLVNIWKVNKKEASCEPVRSMSYFKSYGVAALAICNTSKYLAVLSADPIQKLSIWNWFDPAETPIKEIKISQKLGYQKFLLFCPDDNNRLVSNSNNSVIFYRWNELEIASFSPKFNNADVKTQVGEITSSIFLNNVTISATHLGKFILWERTKSPGIESIQPFHRMDKLVKMQGKAITVLTTVNKYVVTGDVAGQIKFYDESLKLVNWLQDLKLGAITTISFDFNVDYYQEAPEESLQLDLVLSKNAFSTPNFVFGTSMAKTVYVTANGTKPEVIQDNFGCPIDSIDVHPAKPLIALGGQNGLLRMINYRTKESVASRIFDEGRTAMSCLKFSFDGSLLAVGFVNGKLELVHGLNLQLLSKTPLADTVDCISHIEFSENLQFMATADAGNAITMYSVLRKTLWQEENKAFNFLGRYKAHNQQIRNIMFMYNEKTKSYRFMSLSVDKSLVEYSFDASKSGLEVLSKHVVEQSAMPLCMRPYISITKENLILMSNSHYKFKLINATTKMTRKTLLGPTFGYPVKKFVVSTNKSMRNRRMPFIACMLDNKIVLSLLPITGSHHRSFCVVSHPTGVKDLAVSADGQYLFSVGGAYAALMIWSVNLVALEMQEKLISNPMLPFYEQIDGGKNGAFMYQLENLFCYAQLKNQGLDTQERRRVGEKVILTEIPSIMRALGYYPTEQEAYQMVKEVGFN